jgi:hypothetical protein
MGRTGLVKPRVPKEAGREHDGEIVCVHHGLDDLLGLRDSPHELADAPHHALVDLNHTSTTHVCGECGVCACVHVCACGVCGVCAWCYLGDAVDDEQGLVGPVGILDTVIVEFLGDDRLGQLRQPRLHARRDRIAIERAHVIVPKCVRVRVRCVCVCVCVRQFPSHTMQNNKLKLLRKQIPDFELVLEPLHLNAAARHSKKALHVPRSCAQPRSWTGQSATTSQPHTIRCVRVVGVGVPPLRWRSARQRMYITRGTASVGIPSI